MSSSIWASAQARKFSEIAQLLNEHGKFILSYTNFGHHDKYVFEAFSNVQPIADFRQSLARYFTIDRCFPTSHNWHGGQPNRKLIKAANMHLNANIPFISPRLAVEYFFVCSPAEAPGSSLRVPCGTLLPNRERTPLGFIYNSVNASGHSGLVNGFADGYVQADGRLQWAYR